MKRGKRRSRRRHDDQPEQVLYYPGSPVAGHPVRLEGSEAEHALRSLRLRTGDPVCLTDGRGTRYHGSVRDLYKRGLDVSIDVVETLPHWPVRRLWLGAGILRTARMEVLVEKASELGTERLVPLTLKRCVARPQEHGVKSERWHRIAIESLKQSKRARLLEVDEPTDLDGFLKTVPEAASLWFADPAGDPPESLADVRSGDDPVVLVCGPEGGISDEEIGVLRRHHGRPIRLGGNRLRAETAAMALVTVALAVLGEMDGSPEPQDD